MSKVRRQLICSGFNICNQRFIGTVVDSVNKRQLSCETALKMADTSDVAVTTEKVTGQISELKLKQIEEDVASSYVLIDIGANLTNSKYARDLDSVIERAKDIG